MIHRMPNKTISRLSYWVNDYNRCCTNTVNPNRSWVWETSCNSEIHKNRFTQQDAKNKIGDLELAVFTIVQMSVALLANAHRAYTIAMRHHSGRRVSAYEGAAIAASFLKIGSHLQFRKRTGNGIPIREIIVPGSGWEVLRVRGWVTCWHGHTVVAVIIIRVYERY